ncbi:hypothetical protein [Pseudoxanthomonas koreensis]|nr:hypothetical protein [Pseudoxanthomonas koreensis]
MAESSDYYDALRWAADELAKLPADPINALRLHHLRELRDTMQREARK